MFLFFSAMTVSKDPRYAKYFQMVKVVSFQYLLHLENHKVMIEMLTSFIIIIMIIM